MKTKIKNSPRMMEVFELIAAERVRQLKLLAAGKFKFTCASHGILDEERLAILAEEFGEVAREVCEGSLVLHPRLTLKRRLKIKIKLRTELVQLAAVAVAWLETPEVKS